jgi:hypothetical protein
MIDEAIAAKSSYRFNFEPLGFCFNQCPSFCILARILDDFTISEESSGIMNDLSEFVTEKDIGRLIGM